MLAVKLNCHQLEYDIHSLVKAFYPQTEVKVFVEGEKSFASEGDFPFLSLELYEDRIVLKVSQEGKEPLQSEKAVSIEAPFEAGAGRTEYKNELKKLIYHVLSERTGHRLPWGTLTGIRPTRSAGRRESLQLKLRSGKRRFCQRFTMRTDIVCTWGFLFAPPRVCTVPLHPFQSVPGRSVWTSI